MESTKIVEYGPFEVEHLGRQWLAAFGTWRIQDGRLCHYFPQSPGDNVKAMIGAMPDIESFKRLAAIKHAISTGGAARVRVELEIALHDFDGLIVSLDEAGSEWAPYFGMRPVMSDIASGSRGHEFVDLPWPDDRQFHRIEIEGDAASVSFRFDGQHLYSSAREPGRLHHQLMIESFGACAVRRVRIEAEGIRHQPPAGDRAPLRLSAVDDFYDDLCYAKFLDPEMFDRLVGKLHDLGIERIYWLNSLAVRPEAIGPGADCELNRRINCWNHRLNNDPANELSGAPSIQATYPFVEKVVASAHRRGMEVFAVHKPFDLSVALETGGKTSPFVIEHFCKTHPEAMLQRQPEPVDNANAPVARIRFYKSDDREHGIQPDRISVWISDDNKTYRRLEQPFKVTFSLEQQSFARHWEGGFEPSRSARVITLDGLNIATPYYAVHVDGQRRFSFANRIHRLAESFDARGNPVITTRNLPEHPRIGSTPWRGEGGFVFRGFTTCRQETGNWRGRDWIEMNQLLDGNDLAIAFSRGSFPHVYGAPDPVHPETRKFWGDWIDMSLDAGVDGIDLRIMNHNNILDWASYGFGPLTQAAFQRRYGHALVPDENCRKKHSELLGDAYTQFLRDTSKKVRSRGKKMQHHVSRPMDSQPDQRPLINIRWNWRQWIEEGLLDEITLKDLELNSGFCHQVKAHARRHGVTTWHCPYLGVLFDASSTWAVTMEQIVRQNYTTGSDGLMLYEAATFMRGDSEGQINLLYPDLNRIFAIRS